MLDLPIATKQPGEHALTGLKVGHTDCYLAYSTLRVSRMTFTRI